MHQALYRKYRPRSFDDVWGEEHITSVLEYESKAGRVSHAYLFCGPRGTGKTTCAKILAKAVNCEHPVDGNPCGKCFACESIDNGSATDVLEMDAASNNGVEYIRDIRDEVGYTPAALKKRVYIIDEVHMLSQSAFNALLKTLEEPPEHVLFILATTELHKLPATIVSRCQRFDFRRISVDVLANRLLYIAEKEQMALTEEAAKMLAKQAQGGMRDAISLFELCGGGGHEVNAERVSDVLGLTGIETVYKTAVAVARRDTAGIFKIIASVAESSKDIAVYWQELIAFWRDMLVTTYVKDPAEYLDLTEPEMRVTADAARRFTPAAMTYHFGLLDDALREMSRLPQTKRMTAELTLIRMSDPRLSEGETALIDRITALEDKLTLLESGGIAITRAEPTPIPQEQPITEAARISETPKAAEPKKTEPTENWNEIPDISEISEKLEQHGPMYNGFFADADCSITDDGKKILVRTTSDFGVQMLSAESARTALLSSFRLCGYGSADTELIIKSGALPKEKKSPADELAEF